MGGDRGGGHEGGPFRGGGVFTIPSGGFGNYGFGRFGNGFGRFGAFGPFGYGYGLYGYGLWPDYTPDYNYMPPAPAPMPAGPLVTVVYPPVPPREMPRETAHPIIHEYNRPEDYGAPSTGVSAPAMHGDRTIVYLIAFRDSSIRAAMTYWVDHGALHYLDTNHKEQQAPLDSVDRELSAQLNRERNVPFGIQ